MKRIAGFLVVLFVLIGCQNYLAYDGELHDVGVIPVLRDGDIVVESGLHEVGFAIGDGASVDISLSGGLLIDGLADISLTSPGEYYMFLDSGSMSPGDVGVMMIDTVSGFYYDHLGPGPENYASYELRIEVN
jgi:hypothetical protein